jgi:hypothetical protein
MGGEEVANGGDELRMVTSSRVSGIGTTPFVAPSMMF